MHSIKSTLRRVLLGAGASAAVITGVVITLVPAAHAQINDSIRGAPSEANHFIETPRGWKHPKTPWGEPDIQATLNMMQAAGVPLERCANSYRPGAPPCDMNKKWLTEEEYSQRLEAATKPDRYRQAVEAGNFGAAIQAATTDPSIPQRQTNLIVDPPNGLLPALTPEAKRRALTMGSDWALPGEDIAFESAEDFDSWDRCITRGMPSSMMPYRYNGGVRDQAGARLRDLRSRDDSRGARHSHGRSQATLAGGQAAHGRVARPLGRQHARRRDDQLPGRPPDDQPRRSRLAARQSVPHQ
jgi:hypothetical protein